MSTSPADNLVEKGDWGEVRYAIDARGQMPAKDFVERLSQGDSAKVVALFRRIAAGGRIANHEKFRKEEGEIFAFKSFQIRIACFQHGNTWFLTHGFKKKGDNWKAADLEKANRIRKEHLSRANNIQ